MRRLAWCSLAALSALALYACGGDDDTSNRPRPPPTLALASVTSAGGPTWTPSSAESCVEIGSDPAGTIVVNVVRQNFELRPPGACGGLRPCGTVVLLIDGDQVAESATEAVGFGFGSSGLGTGQHLLRVELRDQDGLPVMDPDQKLIGDEATLEVRAPGGCGAGSDAGTDTGVEDSGGEDALSDAPPTEGGPDATPDATPDAGTDAAPDASGDASSDAPADVTGG